MDIERTMQFILEQQAKFTVDVGNLERSVQHLSDAQAETDGRIRTLVDVNLSLASHVGEIDQRLGQFIEVTQERFAATDQKFRETDQKLNTLIDTVDRHIRWHAEHNGGRN